MYPNEPAYLFRIFMPDGCEMRIQGSQMEPGWGFILKAEEFTIICPHGIVADIADELSRLSEEEADTPQW